MKKINLIGAILAAVVVSCSSPKQEEVAPEKPIIEEGHETACVYSYQEATTQVMWVAYKYTQKTGVNGKFEDTKVEGTSTGANPSDVLNGATFEIQTGSVNSGDPTRDPKIVESFFGTLVNGGSISGSVMSVEGSETEGKVTFNLSLNGINKNVEGTYTVVDNKFEAKVELNMADWNAQGGIDKLNKVCEDLHKGADGKSILWPEVTVYVSTIFGMTCE